jgi:bacteriocin-like protein
LLLKELCTNAIKPTGEKTLMNKKNLMSQMVKPVNPLTIKDLPVELLELSEKDLQQVVGGGDWTVSASLSYKDGWGGSVGVSYKF